MQDLVFGDLEFDGWFHGNCNLSFFGNNVIAALDIETENDEEVIEEAQYSTFKAFISDWQNIQVKIAERILDYYNHWEKGAYGPDDENEFKEWWPDIENVQDLLRYIHIERIKIPYADRMDIFGGRTIYVLFNRDWGGEDFDDNGVAVRLVNESVNEVAYKDIAC